MAEYENDTEQYLRELFDIFSDDNGSALYNRLSAAKREKGMITRSVFNTAVKPLVKVFGSRSPSEVFEIFNSYLVAFDEGVLKPHELHEQLFNSTVFKSVSAFFPIVTARVKDRFGPIYSVDNYFEFTEVIGQRIRPAKIATPTNAYLPLVEHLEESLKLEFTL